MGGKEVPGFALFTSVEMSLALGGENVIHAAANAGQVSNGARARLEALARYRGTGHVILEPSRPRDETQELSDDDYDDEDDDEFDDEFDDDDELEEGIKDDEPAMKKSR